MGKTKVDRIREYNEFMNGRGVEVKDLDKIGFFTAPASTKYHGAYEGGLFDHSLEVAKSLVELTDKLGLKWVEPDSPYIVGMYHDLCKCDNYVVNPYENLGLNPQYIYNPEIILPGHGDKSIIMLQRYTVLTDEEIACIRWHMGAYETDTKLWEYYGRAIETYPNVLYTHTSDMIASKIKGV